MAVRNFVPQGLPDVLIMKLTGHKTNHMLHRYHITVEADLRKALLVLHFRNNDSFQLRFPRTSDHGS
jgi:hypothetical protein